MPPINSYRSAVLPCLLLAFGCRDQKPPPPSTGANADAREPPVAQLLDASAFDAPQEVSRWKYADIHELFLRDCPLSMPLGTRAKYDEVGRRWRPLDGRHCLREMPHGSLRWQSVSLMEQNENTGNWRMYQVEGDDDTGGFIHKFVIQYTSPDAAPPRECSSIGVEAAAYARAVMSLSDVETARIAVTYQHLVDSKFSEFAARVAIHDGHVLLRAGLGTSPRGKTACAAGLVSDAMNEDEIAGVVDVPLSPVGPVTPNTMTDASATTPHGGE